MVGWRDSSLTLRPDLYRDGPPILVANPLKDVFVAIHRLVRVCVSVSVCVHARARTCVYVCDEQTLPSNDRTVSPDLRPACSAGEPRVTCVCSCVEGRWFGLSGLEPRSVYLFQLAHTHTNTQIYTGRQVDRRTDARTDGQAWTHKHTYSITPTTCTSVFGVT